MAGAAYRRAAVALLALTGGAASAQDVPQVFAPGVISRGAHEAAPTFTPDDTTVYFQRSTPDASTILMSRRAGAGWGPAEVAAFSGEWNDMEPALAPDGSHLVFVSSRPIAPGGASIDGSFGGKVQKGAGGNLWRVERTAAGWSAPVRLDAAINTGTNVFAPAIARDGSLYFMRPDPATGRFRLFRSQLVKGGYAPPVALPFSTGETTDVDPAIDPDERFLIFGSGRKPAAGMDLFVVTKQGAGWGVPRHLGAINSPGSDAEPRLSADGKTLYFSSERMAPVRFPRTPDAARRESEDAAVWNNGQYNIWSVALGPLLDWTVR